MLRRKVVICFQFWVSLTSLSLLFTSNRTPSCCDLLSILGIFDIAITTVYESFYSDLVVICFQFWVSLTSLSLVDIPITLLS